MFMATKEVVTQCNNVAYSCVAVVLCIGQRNRIYQVLDAHNIHCWFGVFKKLVGTSKKNKTRLIL